MFSLKFFKSRLNYLKALLPFLTVRKALNIIISFIAYFFKLKTSSRVPPVWVIILTYKCNYSCIMCQKTSYDDNPYKNPKSIDFAKIEQLLRAHHKDIVLIQLLGGEPLYYPEIKKVIHLLNELNIAYCITTNGALLKQDLSQLLLKNCVWISFSLDAATPQLYKQIRRGGNMDTISENLTGINHLKKKNKSAIPILNANSTLFTYNLKDLDNLLYYCSEHNITSLSISGGKLYNTRFVNETHLVKNNKEEALLYVEKAKQLAKAINITLRVGLKSIYTPKSSQRPKPGRVYSNYLDLYTSITIQPTLDVVSAGNDYLCMGNLNTDKLTDIWNNSKNGYFQLRSEQKDH